MLGWLRAACQPAAVLATVSSVAFVPMLAWAQSKPAASGIYSCTDDRGRRLTADRPIPGCIGKDQQVLNRDGSLKTVLPPTLTAEERLDKDARERAAAEARATHADAVRRDRNLMVRYPTEASHQRAREAALDTVRLAIRATDMRLRELAAERKPLRDEAEFYKGKTMPAKLKASIDANDASADAQRSAASNQTIELDRINRLYDAELDRLRRLWSGAPAGSLGALPSVTAPLPPATAPHPMPASATRSGPQH